MVRLLFDAEVKPDHEKLSIELKKQFNRFDSEGKTDQARQYFLRDYLVQFEEGILPAQCVVFPPVRNENSGAKLEKAFQQSWHWENAKEQIAACQYELVITELLSLPLAYKKRVECFQKFLYSACQVFKPKALYFVQSEKVVEASTYCAQLEDHGMES